MVAGRRVPRGIVSTARKLARPNQQALSRQLCPVSNPVPPAPPAKHGCVPSPESNSMKSCVKQRPQDTGSNPQCRYRWVDPLSFADKGLRARLCLPSPGRTNTRTNNSLGNPVCCTAACTLCNAPIGLSSASRVMPSLVTVENPGRTFKVLKYALSPVLPMYCSTWTPEMPRCLSSAVKKWYSSFPSPTNINGDSISFGLAASSPFIASRSC